MPIEFACEECGSVLRVPDGSSGKRSRCPSCKHEQEIPWVVSSSAQAVASDKLSIPCPKCQHHLVCSPDLLGKRGQCKKCQHIFTISKQPAASDTAAPALVFHCPNCQQLFEGREEMRGRKGKCHVCKSVFPIQLEHAQKDKAQQAATQSAPAVEKPRQPTVPKSAEPAMKQPKAPAQAKAPPAAAPSASSSASANEEDELLIIDEPQPKRSRVSTPAAAAAPIPAPAPAPAPAPKISQPKPAQPTAPIRFDCTECGGVMEVPGSTAGLETACPYCQTIQTIPNASTSTPAPAATVSNSGGIYGGTGLQSGYDPLGTLDFSAPNPYADPLANPALSNPYAAPTQTWQAPVSAYSGGGSAQVSVGNVLQLGFESLFPSALMIFVHAAICGFAFIVAYILLLAVAFGLRGSGDVGMYVMFGLGVVMLLCFGLMSAWSAGCISRLALDAVRKKPFDFGHGMNPSGGFNSAILVVGGGILIMLIGYLPAILHISTGILRGMEVIIGIWFFLMVPVLMAYGFLSSLAIFAGVDGESSGESIKTSSSLIMQNFGTTLGVMLISGMITGILAIFTLGGAYVLPIYMNAALYHLASRKR